MNHKKEGWECTDADNYQFCLKINENTFRYREFNWFNWFPEKPENLIQAEKDEDNWEDLTIDITKYTDKQIESYISLYYNSVEQIKEIYDNDWKQIIAECIFEQESQLY